MKTKYILQTLVILLFVLTATAQQGINYKAMIKDGDGNAIANTAITVQFTILENGTTDVFKETHNPTTDANGIIIVNIGEGTVVSGAFNDIDWGSNPHFLNTKIDSSDGLTDMGTTEFKTVPYALHALNSSGATKLDELSDAKSDGSSVFIGQDAGMDDNGTDNKNTAIGFQSLNLNISGFRNTAIGYMSLNKNTTGDFNTANGTNALYSNTMGGANTANGYEALYNNDIGNKNTALGFLAGYNSTGSRNIFIGFAAGENETGDDKLYIENSNSSTPLIGGDFAKDSVVINGSLSIIDGTQGNNKVLTSNAEGKASWQISSTTELNDLSDAKTSGGSVFIGQDAGFKYDGKNLNTAIGYKALYYNVTGDWNIAIGPEALYWKNKGNSNIAIGPEALKGCSTGYQNIAIGSKAGRHCEGNGNVFIGDHAGEDETGDAKLYIENSNSSTPLIGGDFALDEVIINGDLEVDGNYTGRLTSPDSGSADMKAYIYGHVGLDGNKVKASSTDGFSSTRMKKGHYRIMFRGLNKPHPYTVSYIVLLTPTEIFRDVFVEMYTDYFDVFTTYSTSSDTQDSTFNFVVYKK